MYRHIARLPAAGRPGLLMASRSFSVGLRALSEATAKEARNLQDNAPVYNPDTDERMIGPYPHIKYEKYNDRDGTLPWDDKQGRRNLGEPLHYQFDLIDVWSPDHIKGRSDADAGRWNLYFIGIIAGFSALCWYTWEEPSFKRREYPHGGLYKALGGTDETKEIFQAREDKELS